jgi:hypothetical protein
VPKLVASGEARAVIARGVGNETQAIDAPECFPRGAYHLSNRKLLQFMSPHVAHLLRAGRASLNVRKRYYIRRQQVPAGTRELTRSGKSSCDTPRLRVAVAGHVEGCNVD